MALWGEQSDENVLDGLLWPRAASAAEVYWTGASATTNGKTDQRSMTEALPRLHDWRYRIVGRGIQATPIQPLWCALRDGQCECCDEGNTGSALTRRRRQLPDLSTSASSAACSRHLLFPPLPSAPKHATSMFSCSRLAPMNLFISCIGVARLCPHRTDTLHPPLPHAFPAPRFPLIISALLSSSSSWRDSAY
jgi:hypothetical protein